MKDQAKNFRLFEETLTILKKAWKEKFFDHKGEFYTYPSPDYVWQHDMSKPSEEFMDMKTNVMKKISVLPQPYQKPYPPIHQVVDGIRSIEWAAQQGLNIIMWIPTVKALLHLGQNIHSSLQLGWGGSMFFHQIPGRGPGHILRAGPLHL